MRVRPFFWGLFVFVCLGILAWADLVPPQASARLFIHLIQPPALERPTLFLVEVTDSQGMTVNDAQIVSQAWMTNMPMATDKISITPEGQGVYLVQVTLSMVGPWMIDVSMQADGFTPLHQMVAVQVLPAFVPGPARPDIVQAPTGSGDAACAAAMASRVTD